MNGRLKSVQRSSVALHCSHADPDTRSQLPDCVLPAHPASPLAGVVG